MTEETVDQNTSDDDPRIAVLQAVVDRVVSWQEGTDADTVRKELDDAIASSDVEIDEQTRQRLVDRISGAPEPAHFDVTEVLS